MNWVWPQLVVAMCIIPANAMLWWSADVTHEARRPYFYALCAVQGALALWSVVAGVVQARGVASTDEQKARGISGAILGTLVALGAGLAAWASHSFLNMHWSFG